MSSQSMDKIWSTARVYVLVLNKYFIFQWSRTQHWVCISVARNHFDLDQMFETLMWRLTAWIVCQLASDPESGDNRCQIHKICNMFTMNVKSNESINAKICKSLNCGFWSNRTLHYFPLSSSVRPSSVTGVTYQLFSIFWRFIPWKPYIF